MLFSDKRFSDKRTDSVSLRSDKSFADQFMISLRQMEDDKWLNFRKMLYVALCFLVFFLSFNSVQNAATEIFRRSGF